MWKVQDEIIRTKGSKVRKTIMGNGRVIKKNEGMLGNWPGKWHQNAKGHEKETEKSNQEDEGSVC